MEKGNLLGRVGFPQRRETKFQCKEEVLRRECQQASQPSIYQERLSRTRGQGAAQQPPVEIRGNSFVRPSCAFVLAMLPELESDEVM
jgi:hypothetical protein